MTNEKKIEQAMNKMIPEIQKEAINDTVTKELPKQEEVNKTLEEMNISTIEGKDSHTLALIDELAKYYGLETYGTHVDLSAIEDLNAFEGTVVTYKDNESNNGIYVFCVQEDKSIGMFVVVPSTISTGPMIRQVTGDITSLITGADLPLLTTFDKIELTGFIISNVIIKPMIEALNIPEGKAHEFEAIYLPRFMSNVARQFLGSEELKEETIEMEPQMVKAMIVENMHKEAHEGEDE